MVLAEKIGVEGADAMSEIVSLRAADPAKGCQAVSSSIYGKPQQIMLATSRDSIGLNGRATQFWWGGQMRMARGCGWSSSLISQTLAHAFFSIPCAGG